MTAMAIFDSSIRLSFVLMMMICAWGMAQGIKEICGEVKWWNK